MKTAFARRRGLLVEKFGGLGIDGLLITQSGRLVLPDGLHGESGALVVLAHGTTLITDGRFAGKAKAETSGIECGAARPSCLSRSG